MKPKHALRRFLLACSSLLAVSSLHADTLTWDPAGGGTSDGAGTWLNTGVWWNGANVDWNNATPDNAIIGNGGAGGTITMGAVTAGTVSVNNFSGTYELKSGSLTQSGGFTVGSTAGNVALTTTTLTGTGGLTMNGPGVLRTQGSTLSYSGTTTVSGGGTLLSFNNLPSGNVTLNNGLLADYYRSTTVFANGLGDGSGPTANQIQIYGHSGFGGGNGNSNWRIGASKSVLQWGSTFFNPTVLQLQTPADNMGPSIYGQVTLDNGLDLNGAQRTIEVLGLGTNPAKSSGTLTGKVHDSTATSAGITKTGAGTLILNVPNDASTYAGSFVIDGGAVIFGSSYQNTWEGESLPSTVNLKINDGVAAGWFAFSRNLGTGPGELQITGGTSGFTMKQGDRYDFTLDGGAEVVWGTADFNPSVFVLNLNDLAPSSPARFNNPLDLNGADRTVFTDTTATFGNSTAFGDVIGRGGNLAGDIQTSTGTAGLIKTGAGAIALSGTNTYDGGTTISEGSLYFTKIAAMPATGTVTVSNGTTLIVPLGGSGWTTGTSGNGTLGGLLAGDGGQSPSTISYLGTSNLGLVVSGTQTYSGVVSSAGNVKTLGTGSLELTEDNTFTGDLIVDGGSTLVLSGDNSGASGDVQIVNGYLEADTANLPGGSLTFASAGSEPAIWVTSGSVTPTLGSANDVFWSGNGGFAATSSALTVTPNAGAALTWSSATAGFNGKILQLGSPSSTAPVTITNDITINNNYTIRLFDNSASSADVSILSGNVVRDGANNRNLTVQGSGTLSLTGTNELGSGQLNINGPVVRAVDGTGLPTGCKLYFSNGILESSGTFTRNIGTGNGEVYWNNQGGFAANGGALSVNLEGGIALNWGDGNTGFRGQNPLYLGSATADNVVTLQNDVALSGNRTIRVYDNPDTANDYAVITGVISGSGNTLTKDGDGKLLLNGVNTYTGLTTVSAGTLGGTGTIAGAVTFNTGSKASFTQGSPMTITGVMTYNNTEVHLNLPAGLGNGVYTLATSSATPVLNGSFPPPVVDSGSYGSGGSGAISLSGNDLVLTVTGAGGGTAYQTWATGSEPFDGDANGDGVQDGLAFLLGAATPSENAIGRLPTVSESGGGLVMTFNCLPVAARGTATLKVAHSNSLAAWTPTVNVVPDADNAVSDNNVTFVVAAGPSGPPALKTVTATIDSGAAAAGKLFGRLEATQP